MVRPTADALMFKEPGISILQYLLHPNTSTIPVIPTSTFSTAEVLDEIVFELCLPGCDRPRCCDEWVSVSVTRRRICDLG